MEVFVQVVDIIVQKYNVVTAMTSRKKNNEKSRLKIFLGGFFVDNNNQSMLRLSHRAQLRFGDIYYINHASFLPISHIPPLLSHHEPAK
jgi:hypothetical protein